MLWVIFLRGNTMKIRCQQSNDDNKRYNLKIRTFHPFRNFSMIKTGIHFRSSSLLLWSSMLSTKLFGTTGLSVLIAVRSS